MVMDEKAMVEKSSRNNNYNEKIYKESPYNIFVEIYKIIVGALKATTLFYTQAVYIICVKSLKSIKTSNKFIACTPQ